MRKADNVTLYEVKEAVLTHVLFPPLLLCPLQEKEMLALMKISFPGYLKGSSTSLSSAGLPDGIALPLSHGL